MEDPEDRATDDPVTAPEPFDSAAPAAGDPIEEPAESSDRDAAPLLWMPASAAEAPRATQPDAFGFANLPKAIPPDVVTPSVRGVRHDGCHGCQKGETPHRSEYGYALNPGHKNPSKGEKAVKRAIADLQTHAVKAVKTLAQCLDSQNPWVALTAARAIVERTVPATKVAPDDRGPALILPPGTRMAILATDQSARTDDEARRQVRDGNDLVLPTLTR